MTEIGDTVYDWYHQVGLTQDRRDKLDRMMGRPIEKVIQGDKDE